MNGWHSDIQELWHPPKALLKPARPARNQSQISISVRVGEVGVILWWGIFGSHPSAIQPTTCPGISAVLPHMCSIPRECCDGARALLAWSMILSCCHSVCPLLPQEIHCKELIWVSGDLVCSRATSDSILLYALNFCPVSLIHQWFKTQFAWYKAIFPFSLPVLAKGPTAATACDVPTPFSPTAPKSSSALTHFLTWHFFFAFALA